MYQYSNYQSPKYRTKTNSNCVIFYVNIKATCKEEKAAWSKQNSSVIYWSVIEPLLEEILTFSGLNCKPLAYIENASINI